MRRLAWALFTLTVITAVGQLVVLADAGALLSHRAIGNGWPIITLACLAGAFFGALIVSRHPRHRVGWLLVVGQAGTQVGLLAQFYGLHVLTGDGWGSRAAGHQAEWVAGYFSATWALVFLAALFLLAPTGALPSRRWRPALWLCLLSLTATIGGAASVPPSHAGLDEVRDLSTLSLVVLNVATFTVCFALVAGAVALVRRLRRAHGDERQQLRWIAASAAFLAGTVALLVLIALLTDAENGDAIALDLLLYVAYASVPVATGVAVLRHRLYDIDLIVNRAVLVTVAAAFAALGYVVLVVLVGGNAGGFWPSLLATAVVAMGFQPLRVWVVRLADRFAYGARAAPYEALSDLGRRLGEAPDPTQLLPAVARAAGEAVSATSAVVRLTVGGLDRAARWPANPLATGATTTTRVPVGHEPLGSLAVTLPRGRELRDHERVLLHRLAEQAALAFGNAGLSAELAGRVDEADAVAAQLAGSRQRVIAARDDERARLELAIRRDVLAHLTPLPDRLAALAADTAPLPAPALGELIDACTAGLEALREITRGVYPAQLARSGLGTALSAHLSRWGRGSLEVEEAAGRRFDARVEAATYFCFAEGVRDFAPPVDVTLAVADDHLVLTLRGTATADAGLQRMRDRLDALGGSVARTSTLQSGAAVLIVQVPVAPVPASRPMATVAG